MKRIARWSWTAGMLGVFLAGVQELSASGPTYPPDQRCYVCEWRIDDSGDPYQVCFETLCSEI